MQFLASPFLFLGTYQLRLAASYIQDTVVQDEDEVLELDVNLGIAGFIRVRVFSRFRNNVSHHIFIRYRRNNDQGQGAGGNGNVNQENEIDYDNIDDLYEDENENDGDDDINENIDRIQGDVPQEDVERDHEHIEGWYCTCQSGARTLGTCAHVAAVLWYMGFARHQPGIKYPSNRLLETLQDAAHRCTKILLFTELFSKHVF